jgi:hypothetical protein
MMLELGLFSLWMMVVGFASSSLLFALFVGVNLCSAIFRFL